VAILLLQITRAHRYKQSLHNDKMFARRKHDKVWNDAAAIGQQCSTSQGGWLLAAVSSVPSHFVGS